ncbi:MAG: hypothetical protein CVT85_01070 [Alphaproteobacteria bacterium HGW-Alphaproteobacteria-7]|nr:MAG: hypothetical protein CVT85_01070 [Alphaproteobacteria bacterium HGW-Alphaproteobacteria-7]
MLILALYNSNEKILWFFAKIRLFRCPLRTPAIQKLPFAFGLVRVIEHVDSYRSDFDLLILAFDNRD